MPQKMPGEGHPLKEGLRLSNNLTFTMLSRPGEGHPLKEGLRLYRTVLRFPRIVPERVIH